METRFENRDLSVGTPIVVCMPRRAKAIDSYPPPGGMELFATPPSRNSLMKFFVLPLFVALCLGGQLQAQPGGRGGFGRFGGGGERVEPEDLKFDQGVASIPDRAAYEKISYKGPDVKRDAYLANLEFVKFIIENAQKDNAKTYFMNTKNHRAHPPYMGMVGINSRGAIRGAITYLPRLRTPDGGTGLYIIDFQPNDSFSYEEIKYVIDTLIAKMPFVKGKISFHPLQGNFRQYERDKAKYDNADFGVHLNEHLYANIGFLPLNHASSFGLLKLLDNQTRPSPREIVICKTLPNQMPRVAGVISAVRQTPLSHVNLRAVQDKVPNAYIANVMQDKKIQSLVGQLVHYKVTSKGYSLRKATKAEVDKHFASLRPAQPQTPARDLSAQSVTALSDIKFEDGAKFGVKTSNLATLQTFKLPDGTVPDGFGVPFYFYDEFMNHNRIYDDVDALLKDPDFQKDREVQQKKLKALREKIKQAEMPKPLMEKLAAVQKLIDADQSLRCRSSTNNEDLPGFSGAGLYDSFTHKPDEGHISKTLKQVYASLWNFRAFEEREFYRIDHKSTAMGVLIHPNFKDEKANGVAVTDDVLYESQGNYYINSLAGEDLVTNPSENASPEEVLLGWWERDGFEVVRRSAAIDRSQQVLSKKHLDEMRKYLGRIHYRFSKLYQKDENDKFAMEVEFKIDSNEKIVIKQARPWVYGQ